MQERLEPIIKEDELHYYTITADISTHFYLQDPISKFGKRINHSVILTALYDMYNQLTFTFSDKKFIMDWDIENMDIKINDYNDAEFHAKVLLFIKITVEAKDELNACDIGREKIYKLLAKFIKDNDIVDFSYDIIDMEVE